MMQSVRTSPLTNNMFKLQVQQEKLGDWVDCSYPPADCPTVYQRWETYTNMFKNYNYRIVPAN